MQWIPLVAIVLLMAAVFIPLNISYYRTRAAMTQEERDAEDEEFELSRGGW